MIIQRPVTITEAFPNVRYPEFEGNPEKRKEYLVDALKSRLKRFSLGEALRYCAHLNLFISVSEGPRINVDGQWPLIQMLFPEKAATKIAKLIGNNQVIPLPTVFSRGQILEIIRWALVYCPENGKYDDPLQNNQSKTAFSEALLIAGEIASLQVEDERLVHETPEMKSLLLLTAVRRLALQSVSTGNLIRSFGRGKMMFFEFLPGTMPNFEAEFKKQNGLSLDEYFACLILVMTSYLFVDLEQGTHKRHFINTSHINNQLPHMVDAVDTYLGIEAQTIKQLKNVLWSSDTAGQRLNLKPLREKPLFWLNEDIAIVLDPVVHMDKATIGPLFMINTPFQERIGYFGKAFEKYAQRILKTMYPRPKPRLLLDDDLIDPGTNKEICDAVLIDDNALLLFEMKAVFIPDDILFDRDYGKYPATLRDKYGKKGQVGDQLAKAVNNLTSGHWALSVHNIQGTKRIYPILIAYDPLLNLPGHFWFCNADFRIALNPDGILVNSKIIMTKGHWEIAPLIILTIDTLENLEASINNFSLTKLLNDYIEFCDVNFRDENDDLSLPEFIHKSHYVRKMDYRGSVATKAMELFEGSKRMLLPQK